MGSEHGSGSSKHSTKDADTDNQKDDAVLSPLISLVDSDRESEANVDIETAGNNSGSIKKSTFSNSASSSSSSESLADDFFQIDADMLKNSSTSLAVTPVAHGNDAEAPVSSDRNDNKLSDLSREPNEADNSESPFVPSPHLSEVSSISPVNSPLPQVMERPGGFDPNRIPASVFSSTPSTNAGDWSVASNDSLFSIQLGNNSFSREQFLMMGGDVNKLEGLHNSGELLNSLGEVKKSGELNRVGLPPLSPVKKLPSVNINTSDVANTPKEIISTSDETLTDSPAENCDDDHFEERLPRLEGNSSSINRQSNGSGASCQSFAFPILTENGRNDSSLGFAKQQNSRPAEYEESPKPNDASDGWWCCCSGPSWSCSSCWSFSWSSSCRQHYCCC